jgi:hypothetical protein
MVFVIDPQIANGVAGIGVILRRRIALLQPVAAQNFVICRENGSRNQQAQKAENGGAKSHEKVRVGWMSKEL